LYLFIYLFVVLIFVLFIIIVVVVFVTMNTQKVFTTAIVVVPPQELWPQIQAIRKVHDKAFVRWPPHINLIYPFVNVSEFGGAASALSDHLSKTIAPFSVTFSNFKFFQHGKSSCTVWCNPQVEKGDELKTLQKNLQEVFPFCDDQSTKSHDGFQPHLSVGQFSGKVQSEQTINEFTKNWSPISFQVNEVFLIARKGEDPFEFKYKIPFRGAIEEMNLPYEAIPGSASAPRVPTQDLFVRNIPFTVTEEEIVQFFNAVGVKVEKVKIPQDYGGRNKGFAFVSVDATLDIQAVISKVDRKVFHEREISVSIANKK